MVRPSPQVGGHRDFRRDCVEAGRSAGTPAIELEDATVAFRLADARMFTAVASIRSPLPSRTRALGPSSCSIVPRRALFSPMKLATKELVGSS